MAPGNRGERRIALAAVAGPHGVKGEVRLKLFSKNADSLSLHQQLYVGGAAMRLIAVRDNGKTPVVRLDGICDRSAAEALRGALIEVDRSSLPELQEGEYYHSDLIGLPAVDAAGAGVGIVAAVENYGAGDLLEIELEDGRRSLIPFRDGIADLKEGRIVLNPLFLA